jgi:dolichol kinase
MKLITKRKTNQLIAGNQDLRKIVHIAIGMFGFLYAFLSFEIILLTWIFATFCAWFLPSKIEPLEVLLNKEENKLGFSLAMIAYGAVMVAGTLIFQSRILDNLFLLAAVAFGDGFSALIGINYTGTPLPWNKQKTWVGTMSFIIFGTIGALAMIFFFGIFSIHIPVSPTLGSLPIFRVLMVMLICAVVESMPWKFTDNIPIGLAAIVTLLITGKMYH